MFLVWERAELSRSGVAPRVELSVDDDPHSETGIYGDTRYVVEALCSSEVLLSQCKAVGVVVDVHRDVELLFQNILKMHLVPRRDIGRIYHYTVLYVHQAGYSYSDAGYVCREYGIDGLYYLAEDDLFALMVVDVAMDDLGNEAVLYPGGTQMFTAEYHAYDVLLKLVLAEYHCVLKLVMVLVYEISICNNTEKMREKQINCISLPSMSDDKKYVFNSRTLSYEVKKRSKSLRVLKTLTLFVISVGMAVLYFWIYTYVLGFEPPKTVLLKKENARWSSKMEVLNRRMDEYDDALSALQMRDDEIYRSIFGMNEIPAEVRNAGFGGVNRYSHLDEVDPDGLLKKTAVRMDVLTKKTYVQSKSFDEVAQLSRRAGEMASCIPAIPPMSTDRSKHRFSSSFGYRRDPFSGRSKWHSGVDFAMKPGNPIYATGDGVVESVRFELFGYGNQIVIDHGFGYKTRYAHMKSIGVSEGMTVKRGECIGLSGNSGRSSGPHLHYEVIYKDKHVNPYNYFDLEITPDEYATMVQDVADISERITMHPTHKKKR